MVLPGRGGGTGLQVGPGFIAPGLGFIKAAGIMGFFDSTELPSCEHPIKVRSKLAPIFVFGIVTQLADVPLYVDEVDVLTVVARLHILGQGALRRRGYTGGTNPCRHVVFRPITIVAPVIW